MRLCSGGMLIRLLTRVPPLLILLDFSLFWTGQEGKKKPQTL